MLVKIPSQPENAPGRFNMTPIIDVVFLLIIFFMLVCQFIVAENFPVAVPDECQFAQDKTDKSARLTTVTVMKNTADGTVSFAVGSQKIIAQDGSGIVDGLTKAIESQLTNVPTLQKTVDLRIDKDISFAYSQYALAAIARSSAANIRLAALKNKHHLSK